MKVERIERPKETRREREREREQTNGHGGL